MDLIGPSYWLLGISQGFHEDYKASIICVQPGRFPYNPGPTHYNETWTFVLEMDFWVSSKVPSKMDQRILRYTEPFSTILQSFSNHFEIVENGSVYRNIRWSILEGTLDES